MSARPGFDWAAMLRAGVTGLGLRPAEFWHLSPTELLLLLGDTGPQPMHRSAFDALAARFPDRNGPKTEREQG